jgi:hypothetical protein
MTRAAGRTYAPTWQELAETSERERAAAGAPSTYAAVNAHTLDRLGVPESVSVKVDGRAFRLPHWQQLVAEGALVRSLFVEDDATHFGVVRAREGATGTVDAAARPIVGRDAFAALYSSHARAFGTIVAPAPETFTPTNIQHFQFLPSVERIKVAAIALATRISSLNVSPAMTFAAQYMGRGTPDLLDDASRQNIETVVRAEQSHMLYHKAMWRAHGRRVVVLDPTTYTLLAHTDLPPFPASLLAAPWPSFYIQLPPKAFEFEVYDVRTQHVDRRYAEGVCVAIDYVEPDYQGVRELAFMVMGEDEGDGSEGRNCAFSSIRFAPDATLDEFATIDEHVSPSIGQREAGLAYADAKYIGHEDLAVHIPRVIVGLMLYLASEHPDVVPIDPAPRRTFADIRSPQQRAAALAREASTLKHATRLPVLVIGAHLDDAAARIVRAQIERSGDDSASRKRWTLDHSVWVRGHWRMQAYGPGRAERRATWIRPFMRGPDAAESMAIRAARVPRAQLNPRHGV